MMAVADAMTWVGAAAYEALSLIGMELAMAIVAAMVYMMSVGLQPLGRKQARAAKKAKMMDDSDDTAGPAGSNFEHDVKERLAHGDHKAVLAAWKRMKAFDDAPKLDLISVVDSMRKLGYSSSAVVAELRSALDSCPTLQSSVAGLQTALLRDNAVDLLAGVVALLEEKGQRIESTIYSGLMGAQLRRKDYTAVAAVADKLPLEALTPKMRAMLAAAAAGRGRIDEALERLRQIPEPAAGSRCMLTGSVAIQILALAAREKRAADAAVELQRLNAHLESKQFEELLTRAGAAAQELADAAVAHKLVDPDTTCAALMQRLGNTRPASGASSGKATGGKAGESAGSELSRHATMIKNHARDRDLKSAAKVFDALVSSSTTLTPLIYNCFLDACVQCGDIERAISHFEEMKRLGFVDVVGYNTVIKAYLAKGCSEKAHSLVREMVAQGLQANKVTYNELIHAKVVEKDRRGIWQLIDEMRKEGVKANSITCSILLKSLTVQSISADVRRVMDLIEEIEEPIDEVLFSSVIEACIRIKQLDLLSDLMRRYRQKGGFVNISAPTYGSMIKAYGQAGDVGRVKELWQDMQANAVKPTSITLGCMTEALVTNNCADEALQLIQEQRESEEHRACLNTVIYSTVLKGFALAKRIDKVFAVYKEMRNHSILCNSITYNTLLDACAKCNSMDRAGTLLEDMKECCVEPDIITYSTIVKGYCLQGDVDRAFHVLAEMKNDDKFQPDEIMYNSILDGCAKQHRVEDALRLLEEMKSSGVGPSNYTLSILVKLLGHARRLNQAFSMVEELSKKNGFRPNVQVYTCLVQACITNRRLEKAMTLHDTMIADAGCASDEKFYAVLARGCLQLHAPLKAVDVVRAAYQLTGHSLATPAKQSRPVGIEKSALEDVCSRLQSGGQEEQEALAALKKDLAEHRKIHVNDPAQRGRWGDDRRPTRGGGRGGRNH
eukprot:gnl/TRDRNA2_/TRDRNA2_172031_c0_seq19.p1 gnl/TRDRNA2_/TRDRNA2_172031_c0~~gnl/TRDRNA2_/TRDRNA2_172031_c0_seq19.p1  ORF type:complete len:953 (+),score=234.25 gnl/TRDRNA2_/TRDRNA2_172031_c0_seq19:173-3031(+)